MADLPVGWIVVLVVVAFAGWAYGVAPTAKHTPRWMVTAAIALLLA